MPKGIKSGIKAVLKALRLVEEGSYEQRDWLRRVLMS